jgi:hypothetical protein
MKRASVILAVILSLPGFAAADPTKRCRDNLLKGQYIFAASGFTRAADSLPGTPWVPKALVEVLQFNGDGTLSTPAITIANPFGDLGNVLQPPSGSPGLYSISDDCSGTVQFLSAANVTYTIHVDPADSDTIWMIQTTPANNVIQGRAKRLR